jgi:hypothetical protein
VSIILPSSIQLLTKDLMNFQEAQKTVDVGLMLTFYGRKNFSHWRRDFPSSYISFSLAIHQRMREFESEQVVPVNVSDANGAGAQDAGGFWEGVSGYQGRAGNFKQNLRGERQRASYGNQGTPCGDIQRGGELQEFFSVFVAASHKDGNRQRQTGPLPVFRFRSSSLQPNTSKENLTRLLPHLGGQTESGIWTRSARNPHKSRTSHGKQPTKA